MNRIFKYVSYTTKINGRGLITCCSLKNKILPRFLTCARIVSSRRFHCSAKLRLLQVANENLHAYNILQPTHLPKQGYFEPLRPSREINTEDELNVYLDRVWRKATAEQITQAFIDVQNYCMVHKIPVSDERFDKLVDGLMDVAEHLTDENVSQILRCLAKFPLCENYSSHNFHDIWSCLDDVCCYKMSEWTADEMLYFADLWFHLHLARLTDFVYHMFDRLVGKADTLTKDQLVKTFFFFNVCRRVEIMFEFQYAIEKCINEMTADEMAVIAMGCFKSQSKIKLLPIAEAMCNRIIEKRDTINEITLAALLKVLRYTSMPPLWTAFAQVLESLVPQMDRLSLVCCIHVALLGTNVQVHNKEITKKTAEKLVKAIDDINVVRLKDIERLLLVVTMFDCDVNTSPDLFQSAMRQLHRIERSPEFLQYPRSLASCLNYLSIKNMYSNELMNRVLDPEYIKQVYGAKNGFVPRELHLLDASIDIECPNYKGVRLSPKNKLRATKVFMEYIPDHKQSRKPTHSDMLFLDVYDVLIRIAGHEKYAIKELLLPHFSRADIVCCLDEKTGKFVKPEGFESYALCDIKVPPMQNIEGVRWLAVMPLSMNHCIKMQTAPLGSVKMKARQLKAIGYEPIFIFGFEFFGLTLEEKTEYITRRIRKPSK